MANQAKELNPFNPVHRQFARLKKRAIEIGVPAENVRLVEVQDIAHQPPYTDEGNVDTISDWDEVWVGWKTRSLVENTANVLALARVFKKSRRVSIWSSRICAGETNSPLFIRIEKFLQRRTGRMGAFPFMSLDDKEWLRDQAAQANPHCQLDYELGLGKLKNKDTQSFSDRVASSLLIGPVAMIGSSTFDLRRANNVLGAVATSRPDRFSILYTGGTLL